MDKNEEVKQTSPKQDESKETCYAGFEELSDACYADLTYEMCV